MNETKKPLSILGTLALAVGAAWAVASLFDISFTFSVPKSFWFAATLTIELAAAWLVQRLRRRMTTKTLMGIVICVTLVSGLIFGLMYALSYLILYLKNQHIFTSFPWYSGFAFAQYLVGPVVVLCGLVWLGVHLREDRRHVKDLKLICVLVIGVTALYGVYKVGSDVWYTLTYSRDYGLPWHAKLFFGILKYALWLLLEWAVWAILTYHEKRWKAAGVFDTPPEKKPLPPGAPNFWNFGDLAIVTVPLAVIGIMLVCLTDTMFVLYNLLSVIGGSLSICLLFVTAAWLTAYHYGSRRKLRHLLWLNCGTAVLTVAAGIVWAVWYNDKEIFPLTGLRPDTAIHLGIAFFTPLLLGQIQSAVLLWRLQKRLSPEKAPTTFGWRILLSVFCVLSVVAVGTFLYKTQYNREVPASVTGVTIENGQTILEVKSDIYISWIAHTEDRQEGHRQYVTEYAQWTPFGQLRPATYGHGLPIKTDVTEIYFYKAPGVYELAACKDPKTGLWLPAGE